MVSIELFDYADRRLDGPAGLLYPEMSEQVATADALGYARVWLTEQHLTARGRVPDSLQMLAFLAARTSRIRLATGVLPAAVHQPVLLLESLSQLDSLSGGRLDVGIGSGSEAGDILGALGISPDETAERTAELYELLAQARPGGQVVAHGVDEGFRLDPEPLRPLLDLVWTAAGRSALDLTARYGTGLLLPRPMPLAARLELSRRYREAVAAPRVVHFKAGLVASSREEARRRAAGFVQDYAARYLGVQVGGPDSADFDDAVERLDLALGEPEQVAERVREWVRGFGDDDSVALQFAGPTVAHADVLASLELFASQLETLRLPL